MEFVANEEWIKRKLLIVVERLFSIESTKFQTTYLCMYICTGSGCCGTMVIAVPGTHDRGTLRVGDCWVLRYVTYTDLLSLS